METERDKFEREQSEEKELRSAVGLVIFGCVALCVVFMAFVFFVGYKLVEINGLVNSL